MIHCNYTHCFKCALSAQFEAVVFAPLRARLWLEMKKSAVAVSVKRNFISRGARGGINQFKFHF